jgi:hypothetical protein
VDYIAGNNYWDNTIYQNRGDGTFTRLADFGEITDKTYGLRIADLNGDLHLDCLVITYHAPHRVYLQTIPKH